MPGQARHDSIVLSRRLEQLDRIPVGVFQLCFPAGPTSISLRKRRPAFLSDSTSAGRSAARSTTRFHPPGS
jgi:hypothetical protein